MRESPFTNSRRVLLLSLLLLCSPVPFSKLFYPKCLTVPCVDTFLAPVAPLGMHHQPLRPPFLSSAHHRHRGGGGAMLCQLSNARPHTSFPCSLGLGPHTRFCNLLERRPALCDSCLGHGRATCFFSSARNSCAVEGLPFDDQLSSAHRV